MEELVTTILALVAGRGQRDSGLTRVEDGRGGPGEIQDIEGVALKRGPGAAVLSVLNALGKPSRA